jgi:CubicO group peptidase (beta-lactamase class C family)
VAIVNQDGTLYERGFGYSDIESSKKCRDNTIQKIASISKTFIGIALHKAQELGELNLGDPINMHLSCNVNNPYFPNE